MTATKEKVSKEDGSGGRIFAMHDFGDAFCESFLSKALLRVRTMFLKNFIDSFFIENGVDFDEIFDRFVSLVEPELIKIKD